MSPDKLRALARSILDSDGATLDEGSLVNLWSDAIELARGVLKVETAGPFQDILQKTDWALLRQQKLTLIQLATNAAGKEREDLEGLLCWLDFVQDLAADHPEGLGAKAVFGKM